MSAMDELIKEITTTCGYDCGGRCLLKVRVAGGRVAHVGTENRHGLHMKACPRGLAQEAVLNHNERLSRPLERVGARGEGRFRPIPWDEALDRVARELDRIRAQGRTESIYFVTGSGSLSTLHSTSKPAARFFGMLGRCTTTKGTASFEGALQSSLATFGTALTGSSRDTLLDSKCIILWGWNPAVTRMGPETMPILSQARKKGARIVCVDPRYTRTARKLAHEWVAVRPGTDAAMLTAMAHVIVREGLYDSEFIRRFTSGFEPYRDYLSGRADGLEKTPRWAAEICGVDAETIARLALSYGREKPAALMAGWAPGRTLFGEQFHRAASVLAALTGNIGVSGGEASGGVGLIAGPSLRKRIPLPGRSHRKVHVTSLYDALLAGPRECEILYIVGSNLLNQCLHVNKGRKALLNPTFTVVHDLFLTPTARYADLVLPVTHFMEREDIGLPYLGGPYGIFMNKVVEPAGQKSDLEIFSLLAERLGMEGYNDRSDAQWLESFLTAELDFPNARDFREKGVHVLESGITRVAFEEHVGEGRRPFPTPSGKIEIFSRCFAKLENPEIPPLPTYMDEREFEPESEKYPIRLISPHSRARVNSQFDNIRALKRIGEDRIWVHPADAESSGISDGEKVMVTNSTGRVILRARVTRRIMHGVAAVDPGQWYDPDEDNVDKGGCVNVLIPDRCSPAGAFPSNTCRVRIEAIRETPDTKTPGPP